MAGAEAAAGPAGAAELDISVVLFVGVDLQKKVKEGCIHGTEAPTTCMPNHLPPRYCTRRRLPSPNLCRARLQRCGIST